MKTQLYKIYGCSKNSSRREVHGDTGLIQETRKISNNLTYQLKELEKEQTKPKVSRRKEIIKIREEVNRDQKNNRSINPRADIFKS